MAKVSAEFGEMVSKELEDRKLSLRGVMYKTGVSHAVVSDMRHGVVPTKNTVEKFALGLGIDPMPFLIASGYERAYPSDPVQAVDQALRHIQTVSEQKRARLLELVRKELENPE